MFIKDRNELFRINLFQKNLDFLVNLNLFSFLALKFFQED